MKHCSSDCHNDTINLLLQMINSVELPAAIDLLMHGGELEMFSLDIN